MILSNTNLDPSKYYLLNLGSLFQSNSIWNCSRYQFYIKIVLKINAYATSFYLLLIFNYILQLNLIY